jgi:hypothetical protein
MPTAYVPTNEWPIYTRATNRAPVPVGYIVDPSNELICVVNPLYKAVMEEALDYVDAGQSYRDVAQWLAEKIGRNVSHTAISNMWKKVRGHLPYNPRKIQQNRQAKKLAPKTPKEKAELEVKRKLRGAKISVTKMAKKLENFKEKPPEIKPVSTTFEHIPEEKSEFDGKTIIFQPNPGPQETFLAAPEQEVLYGGAAGGGKSYALLADPLRYFGHPRFSGLLLRRTNDELRELKWKSKELYTKAYPGAIWREKDNMWLFPSGAQLWMSYLDRDEDVLRYQGQAFSYICFDELTQWPTRFPWDYMRSRLRTADEVSGEATDLPIYMRATTNPGGPGHGWVKRMFVDPAPPGEPFDATDIDTNKVLEWPENDKKGRKGPLFQRRFIPARLSDNPYLYDNGQYEANLLSLSEQKRRQLLEGDWAVADGAAFPEFRYQDHTVAPFEIPNDWKRFRSCDYGYQSFAAVHWYAIDPAFETLYVYRELYCTRKTGAELSVMVQEAERGESIQYGMLDSSVWHQRGQTGPSIAEEMIQAGTRWRPSDRSAGSRVNGKNRLHELLKIDEYTGKPGIIFFETCRQIIADLPIIPADPDGDDDIDKRYASDHAYDSIRYGIMSRPRSKSPFDFGPGLGYNYRPANPRFGY